MSKAFREKYGTKKVSKEKMRKWCNRPGDVDQDGNILYLTEQHHKDDVDIKKIIQRYDRTGVLTNITQMEARFGDVDGADYREMMNVIVGVDQKFDALPSEIRNRFQNDPAQLLEFMEDPNNREEAIRMGFIREEWDPSVDGLGEHVIRDENFEVTPESPARDASN